MVHLVPNTTILANGGILMERLKKFGLNTNKYKIITK